tara:strand:- start:153 stop:302 length:150 start_codon:yes stop_codon:yes gene_type:complete
MSDAVGFVLGFGFARSSVYCKKEQEVEEYYWREILPALQSKELRDKENQ